MLLCVHVEPLRVTLHSRATLTASSLNLQAVGTRLPVLFRRLAVRLLARRLCGVPLRPVARVALLLRGALQGALVDWVDELNLIV